jgi:protein SCO1
MRERFMKALFVLIAALLQTPVLAGPACCSTNSSLPAAAPTDKSLYQIETTWRSDLNKPFKLAQLTGKPQIVAMFFASCEYACPILVHDVRRIEAGLQEAGLTNVGFVLVTIDTERDTVKRLHEYRSQRGLDDNWLLLRGTSEDTLELAALLGVKYKKDARGQYAHSNVITTLNAAGEIVHQQIGLNVDPAETIAAVKKLGAAK